MASILSQVVYVGNVGQEPTLRELNNDNAVVNLSIGITPRRQNRETQQWEDGETMWKRVSAWGTLARNVAASIKKGDRIIVAGREQASNYTNNQGQEVSATEVVADFIGADLTYATATVTRVSRGNSAGSFGAPAGAPAAAPAATAQSAAAPDPWAAVSAGPAVEPPPF